MNRDDQQLGFEWIARLKARLAEKKDQAPARRTPKPTVGNSHTDDEPF